MTRYLTLPASADSSSRFLDALARALEESGRRAIWVQRKYVVLFREGDTLNRVRPFPWGSESPDAPQLTRIAINQSDIEISRRARILLGFAPESRPGHDERFDLEFTVLTEELEAIARWLPSWIAGRVDPEVPLPAPPVPCDPWEFDWRSTNYVWSTAAWNAQTAWEERVKAARLQRTPGKQAHAIARPAVSPAAKTAATSPAAHATSATPASGGVTGPARPGTEADHV